jgi:mannobiose 2-epimerase
MSAMKRVVWSLVIAVCWAGFVAAQLPALPADRDVGFLLKSARAELFENILPFWLEYSFEDRNDGFVGALHNNLKAEHYAPKGLSVTARILWFFSAAHRMRPDDACLKAAARAYDYLEDYFLDEDEDGYFWRLQSNGNPQDRNKVLYGHAFMIYAFSEYALATGEKKPLRQAQELFKLIEAKCRDEKNAGYFEGFNREWEVSAQTALTQGVPAGGRTMNTHLHMLEAYANLYRAWPDPRVKEALNGLIRLFLDQMLDRKEYYFHQAFDEEWKPVDEKVSFGHDLEAVWLLCDAAEALGDQPLIEEVHAVSLKVADAVLRAGVDKDGGLFLEGRGGDIIDAEKIWWVQAEGVTGFLQAWQISQDPRYLNAAAGVWRFIEDQIVDQENGEWFNSASPSGKRPSANKISEWKGPYHNGRACIELIKRLE